MHKSVVDGVQEVLNQFNSEEKFFKYYNKFIPLSNWLILPIELHNKLYLLTTEVEEEYNEVLNEIIEYVKRFPVKMLIDMALLRDKELYSHIISADQSDINESYEEGFLSVHHIEMLQCLYLIHNQNHSIRNSGFKSADNSGYYQTYFKELTRLKILLKRLSNLWEIKLFRELDTKTPETFRKSKILKKLEYNTFRIRNEAHGEQLYSLAVEIYQYNNLHKYVELQTGINPIWVVSLLGEIFRFFSYQSAKRGELIDQIDKAENIQKIQKILSQEEINFDKNSMIFLEGLPLKEYKSGVKTLIETSDTLLYSIDINHLDQKFPLNNVEKVLNELSIDNLGDIYDTNLFLNNPILLKPFIKIKEHIYICPCTNLLSHSLLDILRHLLDKKSCERLDQIKGKFLEEKIVFIISHMFPRATIHRNFYYNDDIAGRVEGDVMVIIEQSIFIFEAKAKYLDQKFRYGYESNVKKVVRQLIEENNSQVKRLERFITSHLGKVVKMINDNDEEILLDLQHINEIISFGVTLESLGTLSTQQQELLDMGFIRIDEVCVNLSITDLKTIFNIMNSPFESIYYLKKRLGFEQQKYFIADEWDLMAFYLHVGFNIDTDELHLYGFSHLINDLFRQNKKSSRFKNKKLLSFLLEIERSESKNKVILSDLLLDINDEDIDLFFGTFNKIEQIKLWKSCLKENPHLLHMIDSEVSFKNSVLIGCVYENKKAKLSARRQSEMLEYAKQQLILRKGHKAIMVGVNINNSKHGTTFIFYYDSSTSFEEIIYI